MSVAPVSQGGDGEGGEDGGDVVGEEEGADGEAEGEGKGETETEREALMILGVDKEVGVDLVRELVAEKGILEVSVVTL